MTNPKTILVTGCAGFIGSNFVKQFRTHLNNTSARDTSQFPQAKIIGIDVKKTYRKTHGQNA